ncbi:Na/Pi cotransporter family protein [Thiopseudomonas alkaliphila]|uniref:Na/Pi cotransporter family protein n=1 Tax=Thiopseudomonas alkaliphila TaxID=1697053 RepID=UPI00257899A7|nr:Na/Pi symporter [Thiopseudomonas alkaliphila]MDM1708516.1 Na/Pi cotransporter family protein [Thiopseudomonas alkaliphila]
MNTVIKQLSFITILITLLSVSFWFSASWLQLCAGLALFLFGMQCLEEGLKQLAGSKLDTWLERSTATRGKSFLFGMGGTMLLQSTTLMSLLTIAFISTGLIQLAGGIAILLGINLGTSAGIWLLAAAGQGFSLSPLALPLLVFGVLAGFHGSKGKAAGRLVLGIAFIFLGIDQLKVGFSEFGDSIDFTQAVDNTLIGQLILVAIGLLLTSILQSSHATLMLILAALATGQIELWQGMALAIGGNVGSSVTTAIVGWLGGNRGGQRLVLVHVLFNLSVGIITLLLLSPLAWLCQWLMQWLAAGDNPLLQLALFQTLFNLIGVGLFWPWQNLLEKALIKLLPDRQEPEVLIADQQLSAHSALLTQARYLSASALTSPDTASRAVVQELQHLGRLSLEVICHALYQPIQQLLAPTLDEARLMARPEREWLDAQVLYERHIKGVYGDLLDFISRLDIPNEPEQQQFWRTVQIVALQLVDAVKDAKHLQKNLGRFLQESSPCMQQNYFELRKHLIWVLRQVREMGLLELPDEVWRTRLDWFDGQAAQFDHLFRQQIFAQVRDAQLNGHEASSLMNDLGYCSRITQSLRNVMQLGLSQEGDLLREMRRLSDNDEMPLISV